MLWLSWFETKRLRNHHVPRLRNKPAAEALPLIRIFVSMRASGGQSCRRRMIFEARRFPVNDNRRAVLFGALAVPVAILFAAAMSQPGPLSWHMGLHIAAMNVIAPLLAVMLGRYGPSSVWSRPGVLWGLTLAQLTVLWAAHSPTVHHHLLHAAAGNILLHAVLFAVALAFWTSVAAAVTHRWQAMLALLISGKFACLLGVLLIFAPRLLFGVHAEHAAHTATSLIDQQLAGLLMVTACPLS
jgi:putative membrane protein